MQGGQMGITLAQGAGFAWWRRSRWALCSEGSLLATRCCAARLRTLRGEAHDDNAPPICCRLAAVPRGVVGNERCVVILSDGVEGVGQDASRTVFARSTSFVEPSSLDRSRRAIEASAR